ncbi:MAG: hypothetical protein E7361_03685 [Clostridiales bacterium]|nr:hypothetical protein [Clostridiales bacterium]
MTINEKLKKVKSDLLKDGAKAIVCATIAITGLVIGVNEIVNDLSVDKEFDSIIEDYMLTEEYNNTIADVESVISEVYKEGKINETQYNIIMNIVSDDEYIEDLIVQSDDEALKAEYHDAKELLSDEENAGRMVREAFYLGAGVMFGIATGFCVSDVVKDEKKLGKVLKERDAEMDREA